MRRANGDEDPYGVKLFCLGNEQYGSWEYGHAPAEVYGIRAREVVKQVRNQQPDAKFILCGDADSMEWNEKVLDICYDYVDMLSIHFGIWTGEENDDTYFDRLNTCHRYIEDSVNVCEKIRKKHNSEKHLTLSVDEWILWDSVKAPVPGEEWTCGMHLLEQDYVLRDVLMVGGLYSLFHNTADKVSLVCEAQTVNVIAPIRTAPNGVSWKQGIYYPIRYASHYGRGTALKAEGAPARLLVSAVDRKEQNEVALYLTNTTFEEIKLDCGLIHFNGEEWSVTEAVMLTSTDEKSCNTADKTVLAPEELKNVSTAGNTLNATLSPPLLELRSAAEKINAVIQKTAADMPFFASLLLYFSVDLRSKSTGSMQVFTRSFLPLLHILQISSMPSVIFPDGGTKLEIGTGALLPSWDSPTPSRATSSGTE